MTLALGATFRSRWRRRQPSRLRASAARHIEPSARRGARLHREHARRDRRRPRRGLRRSIPSLGLRADVRSRGDLRPSGRRRVSGARALQVRGPEMPAPHGALSPTATGDNGQHSSTASHLLWPCRDRLRIRRLHPAAASLGSRAARERRLQVRAVPRPEQLRHRPARRDAGVLQGRRGGDGQRPPAERDDVAGHRRQGRRVERRRHADAAHARAAAGARSTATPARSASSASAAA